MLPTTSTGTEERLGSAVLAGLMQLHPWTLVRGAAFEPTTGARAVGRPGRRGRGHSAACVYALTGDHERALDQIRLAVATRYEHLDLVKDDPDLDAVRHRAEFRALFGIRD
jgi:hypothetical protein